MPLRVIANAIALLTLLAVADEQIPLAGPSPRDPPRVAIVGAGIAGASTTFRLEEMAYPFRSLNITIFERESSVGGRVKTISPSLEEPAVLEVGASPMPQHMLDSRKEPRVGSPGLGACGMANSFDHHPRAMWNLRRGRIWSAPSGNTGSRLGGSVKRYARISRSGRNSPAQGARSAVS